MLILELSLISTSPADFGAQNTYFATCYQIVTRGVLLQLRQNEGLINNLTAWGRIQRINVGGNISRLILRTKLLSWTVQLNRLPSRFHSQMYDQEVQRTSTKLQNESPCASALVWTHLHNIIYEGDRQYDLKY
jgi:hypothetical protein